MLDTCKDCFNGCVDQVPDNCVKYTGIAISFLGIKNGDSYAVVQNKIFNYILFLITGEGIKISLDNLELCELISTNLSSNSDINLEGLIKAITASICFLNSKVTDLTSKLNLLESDYTVKCLEGVTNKSDTHSILQSTINKICQIQTAFTVLLNDLNTNYITVGNINSYIIIYNETIGNSNLISSKMIPYVAMPYFPTTSVFNGNFDSSGAGIGNWLKVYLCNGKNNTPDLRGRALVGATTGMAGDIITDVDVLPSVDNYPNPNYGLKTSFGKNSVTLNNTQVPNHTHSNKAISVSKDSGHNHIQMWTKGIGGADGNRGDLIGGEREVSKGFANITTDTTVTIDLTTGGGNSHNNIQPSIGAYYIMYIP